MVMVSFPKSRQRFPLSFLWHLYSGDMILHGFAEANKPLNQIAVDKFPEYAVHASRSDLGLDIHHFPFWYCHTLD